MKVNKNYKNIAQSYLFSTIAKKVSEFSEKNPDKKIIKLGIGDVTLPLCQVVVDALIEASKQQGVKESFKGYGPEQGYEFLKKEIHNYYSQRGTKPYLRAFLPDRQIKDKKDRRRRDWSFHLKGYCKGP